MRKHTRRDRSEYEALLSRKESERLTYAELASESGVPVATLQYWARKLRTSDGGGNVLHPSESAFLQVNLSEQALSPIEVVVGDDIRIAVRPGFDASTLRAVIELLAC